MNYRIILEADKFIVSQPYKSSRNIYAILEKGTNKMEKVRKFKNNFFGNIATIKYEGEHYVIYETDGNERSFPKNDFYHIYTEIKEHEFWVNVYEYGVGLSHGRSERECLSIAPIYDNNLGKFIRTQKFTAEF